LLGGVSPYAAGIGNQIASDDLTAVVRTAPHDHTSLLFSMKRKQEQLMHRIGTIKYCADSIATALHQTGQNRTDVLSKPHSDLADDRESEADKWCKPRKVIERRELIRAFVNRVRRVFEGGPSFLSISGKPIWDANSQFCGYGGVAREVTDRVNMENEPRTSQFFESMDRVNRDIQGTKDLDRMVDNVLNGVLSIFGSDRAWLVCPCDPHASSWRVAMEATRSDYPSAFAKGQPLPVNADIAHIFELARLSPAPVLFGAAMPHPVPYRLAQQFSVRSMMAIAVYPQPDSPYMFGMHQCSDTRVWSVHEEQLFQAIGRRLADALAKLLMLRDLKENEERLKNALRMAHVGYWDRDMDSDCGTWCDEACRILGIPSRSSDACFADELPTINPEDRPWVTRAVTAAVDCGMCFDVEFRVLWPDGDVRVVQHRGSPVTDESGRLRRMFGTIQDITDRKRAEEQLAGSERRFREVQMALVHANRIGTVGRFTAEIAHEIKQPIAAASTYAAAALRWLRAQPPNIDEALLALNCIVDATRRTSDVIVGVRQRVRKTPISESFLQVNDTILEVMSLINGEVENNGVSARVRFAEGSPLVHGDRVQLQQVMLNLSINAIEAMSSGSGPRELSIETGLDAQGNVLVAVRDSGPGLGPEALEQIFDPFYTTKAAGMGIGLSISRSIVEAHGGRLWASANPAGGAVFQFFIPTAIVALVAQAN
jgi:PAS domain S-box-containing protein